MGLKEKIRVIVLLNFSVELFVFDLTFNLLLFLDRFRFGFFALEAELILLIGCFLFEMMFEVFLILFYSVIIQKPVGEVVNREFRFF